MTTKIENAILGLTLGAVPVVACFLAAWWTSIPLVPESRVFQCALAGLFMGMLVDVVFLRGWIRRAYSMKTWLWMAVYVFYSIGLLGFFMGVPVFNVALAVPAGIFVGRCLVQRGADADRMKKAARQAAIFTTSILGVVCLTSATLALLSSSTASDLQGMLGLPFQVTPTMILALILGGGAAILALDWWFTIRAVERAYRYFVVHAKPAGE